MPQATIAPSLDCVPYSRIRQLAEMAMQMGDGVLKLYFGESNLPTPEYIKRAAQKAMADGFTFYTENAGLLSTRRAIADYARRLHNVDLDPATEVVVTASGEQALHVAVRGIVDPGDEAVVLTPAFPNGGNCVRLCHGTIREVVHPVCGDKYAIDFEAVEAAVTPRTRALMYTSPSNPLGWVATEADQEKLLELARRHGLWLVADEVYERLYYRGPGLGTVAPSILRKATRDDAVVVVQSMSKGFCMTGWRLGWVVARRDLAKKITELNELFVMSAPTMAQKAAETALVWGDMELKKMLARLKENRDFALAALRKMRGVTVPDPDGAFYLFPRIQGVTDSFAFAKQLLEETMVGVAPGNAFGPGGEGSVRICYAAERTILEPALQRLGLFLKAR